MNLRRLEYFSVLAQIGNLHKASEMLHVSPPALSKAMKVLEEELEMKLWVRNGRNIILTDAGKTLLKKSGQLLDEVKNLKESLTKDSKSKPIRIGTFEVFSTYFLDKHGFHEPTTLLCPIPRKHINMFGPQTLRTMICVTVSLHMCSAMFTRKLFYFFYKFTRHDYNE